MPDIVSQTAGANKGLQVSNGSCSPTTPPPTPTTPDARPDRRPTADPTDPTPDPTQPSGTNLSIGAGADGSSKASGTSYGNVRDGNLSTYWSPAGSTGYISIKWGSATTVSRINIREASGSTGSIGSWQVVNADTGAVLTSGSGAGVITFAATSLKKITFEITSSTAVRRRSPSSRPTPECERRPPATVSPKPEVRVRVHPPGERKCDQHHRLDREQRRTMPHRSATRPAPRATSA